MKDSTLFTFLYFDVNSPIQSEQIQDLLDEKITGIIFKNFLNKVETEQIKTKFSNLPIEKKTIINSGFHSYPLSFAQFTQMKNANLMTIEDYINTAESVLNNQQTNLGLDVTQKLFAFLKKLVLFEEVSPIISPFHNKPLIPFNVRELFPGNGELIVHCENLFFDEFPNFFNWLKLMNIKENKLSYFITIQASESGGELCCYDLNWDTFKVRENPQLLKDIHDNKINPDDEKIRKVFIKPDEGDLILFAGGNVWHKVTKVQGSKSRITIGGFVAETNERGKYYVWS